MNESRKNNGQKITNVITPFEKKLDILSVILGSLITTCLLIAVENLLSGVYFFHTDEILLNEKLFGNAIEKLPPVFYVSVIFFNVCASFLGGMLPIVIGKDQLLKSILVGGIVTVFMIFNMYIIPFPVWYKMVSIAICLPVSYTGGLVTKKMVS